MADVMVMVFVGAWLLFPLLLEVWDYLSESHRWRKLDKERNEGRLA